MERVASEAKLGPRIRELRLASGMSLREFSQETQIGRSTLARIEQGSSNRSDVQILQIAEALRARGFQLYPDDDTPFYIPATAPRRSRVVLRSRRQVLFHSKLVIFALEGTLQKRAARQHHNRHPEDLIIDDDEYIAEIRNLVAELKRLNSLLQESRSLKAVPKKPVVNVKKHLNTFSKNGPGRRA
jgi:transcriptional regulator with XRE-family HTH domain